MIMNRSGCLLLVALLAAVTNSVAAMSAEADVAAVVAQDLLTVRDSGKVKAAIWTRRPDSYTLQLVTGVPSDIFVGRTIANLRGLDPSFGTRTLQMVEGRRVAGQRITPLPRIAPKIQVWLLRADGTQILPTWRSAEPVAGKTCSLRCIATETLFRFSLPEGAQAVAAAISIDEQYYIEKLQPLASKPAAQ
jgi:hypothetical protein